LFFNIYTFLSPIHVYYAFWKPIALVLISPKLSSLHDPYFPDAPKEVKRDEFLLAWLERDYWYAVIRLTDLLFT